VCATSAVAAYLLTRRSVVGGGSAAVAGANQWGGLFEDGLSNWGLWGWPRAVRATALSTWARSR
jgi:hypothetical protein